MKKNKISKNWIIKQHRDPFFKQSKIQGYRSRSAFKLIEMNKKFKFLKKNLSLLDLGSCPGGWSQVASREIIKGKILAVDIKHMEKIENVDFINGDFYKNEIRGEIISYFNNKKADVVLSDMAANTTGHRQTDHIRTTYLLETALDFAIETLQENGVFLAKCFKGGAEIDALSLMRKHFSKVNHIKPDASRKESVEGYVIATGFKCS